MLPRRRRGRTTISQGFTFGDEASGDQSQMPAAAQPPGVPRSGEHRIAGAVGLQLPDRGRLLLVRSRQEGRPRVEVRRPLQLHRAPACLADQRERARSQFNSNLAFDAANPITYPERLSIRMGTFNEFINNHTYEFYAQDKWKMGGRSTLSVGVRYDLEIHSARREG